MTNWKTVRITCGTVALGLLVVASGHAWGVSHENKLTFSRPVALPGVVLPAGTYTFDVASATALDVVVVRDKTRTKVYYMGFTTLTQRPAGMSPKTPVVFAEAPANEPRPILAWYEIGGSTGHEFLYR